MKGMCYARREAVPLACTSHTVHLVFTFTLSRPRVIAEGIIKGIWKAAVVLHVNCYTNICLN